MKKMLEEFLGLKDKDAFNEEPKTKAKKKLSPLLLFFLLGAAIFPVAKSKESIIQKLSSIDIFLNVAAALILSYGLFIGYKKIIAQRKLNLANGFRVWLDDERPVPEGFTHWVKTAEEAIELLKTGRVKHISLDHDLGDEEIVGTGYHVACWIEENAHEGSLARFTWNVHSANPTGRDKMKSALNNADLFWDKAEVS